MTEYPTVLSGLTPREAVIDALHRSILGIDSSDEAMYKSSLYDSPETSFKIGDSGNTIQGAAAISEYIITKIFPLTTLHQISNVRVDLKDGADTARLTANAVAHHYRPEDAFKPERLSYVSGGQYDVGLVRDKDGLWKIKDWTLKMTWSEGDSAVIFG